MIIKYLKFSSQIILPKHVIVRNIVSGQNLYFGPKDTKPSQNHLLRNQLQCVELDNIYVVSRLKNTNQYHDQHEKIQVEKNELSEMLASALIESSAVGMDYNEELIAEIRVADYHKYDAVHDCSNDQDSLMTKSLHDELIAELRSADYHQYDAGNDCSNDQNSWMTNTLHVESNDDDDCDDNASNGHENSEYGEDADNPDFSDDDPSEPTGSNSSFGTIDPELLRTQNIFLKPERVMNGVIISLIHTTKQQFLEFVERSQVQSGKNSRLSRYSKAFLFRLKLAGNWSFSNLSCVFGITTATVRNIFWEVARKVYLHALAIQTYLTPTLTWMACFKASSTPWTHSTRSCSSISKTQEVIFYFVSHLSRLKRGRIVEFVILNLDRSEIFSFCLILCICISGDGVSN